MHLSRLVFASVSALFLQLAFGYVIEVPEAVQGHGVSARIFGGYDADISDFPYQVRLEKLRKHKGVILNKRGICGGSIISEKFILTAAHCIVQTEPCLDPIEAEDLYVYANGSVAEDQSTFSVKNIFMHPNAYVPPKCRKEFSEKDVAILELVNPLPLGPGIQIIPLAKADTTIPEGTKANISGWGSTCMEAYPERLQAAEVSIASNDACLNCYRGRYNDDKICAGAFDEYKYIKKPIRGTLPGDSGGPLVVDGVLEGVIQAINNCARCPGLYVRIASSDIRAFIKNVTGI